MQRHHDGVIELERLRQRNVKAVPDGLGANVARQRSLDFHAVARHGGLVIGPARLVGDADRKRREIVQEESVEVVVGIDQQNIGRCRVQVLGDLGIEFRGPAVRTLLCHERGKVRGMRHAEGGDDLAHMISPRLAAAVPDAVCAQTRSGDKPRLPAGSLC